MRALLVLLIAVSASAGAFVPGSKAADAYSVYSMDVLRGRFDGWPAARLRWAEDRSEVLAIVLPSAPTWGQARSACRLMTPRGEWDLPSSPEADAVARSRGLKEELAILNGDGYYPVRVFEGEEAARRAQWYSNDTLDLLTDAGILGMYDMGALQMMAADPAARNHAEIVRALSELPKSPVVCVSRRKY